MSRVRPLPLLASLTFAIPLIVGVSAAQAYATVSVEVITPTADNSDAHNTPVALSDEVTAGAFYAKGAADLSTGMLHAVASADPSGKSTVGTEFADDLTFSSGVGETGYVVYHWDGGFSRLSTGASNDLDSTAALDVAVETGTAVESYNKLLLNVSSAQTCMIVYNCQFGQSIDETGEVAFKIGTDPTHIAISLSLIAQQGTVANFSNTAQISLILPAGVTYTSATGEFLAAAVPEPAAPALLLSGMAVIAALARRRAARATFAGGSSSE